MEMAALLCVAVLAWVIGAVAVALMRRGPRW
jgi:hypothetical protein